MPEPVLPRVLVVDDDPASGRAIARVLAAKAEVTLCGAVDDALARILSGEVFDLVLCDVMMRPKTGPDFFELAVAAVPGLADRIVFMSGGMSPTEAGRIAALGARCLAKPVPTATMMALLHQAAPRR